MTKKRYFIKNSEKFGTKNEDFYWNASPKRILKISL